MDMTKKQKYFWLASHLLFSSLTSWLLDFGIAGWLFNCLLITPVLIYLGILVVHKQRRSYPY